MSSDPERRLAEHNSGKNRSTKAFKPWKIVCTESFKTLAEARKREVFLKSGHGRAYLDKKLNGLLPDIYIWRMNDSPASRSTGSAMAGWLQVHN